MKKIDFDTNLSKISKRKQSRYDNWWTGFLPGKE